MIPKNSRLPAAQNRTFFTTRENPDGIRIRLLEGEASEVAPCTVVGDVRIVDLPDGLPVGSPVEVRYKYDESRRIHVRARELTGDREATVSIVWAVADPLPADDNFRNLIEEYRVD